MFNFICISIQFEDFVNWERRVGEGPYVFDIFVTDINTYLEESLYVCLSLPTECHLQSFVVPVMRLCCLQQYR